MECLAGSGAQDQHWPTMHRYPLAQADAIAALGRALHLRKRPPDRFPLPSGMGHARARQTVVGVKRTLAVSANKSPGNIPS
jgi:hypothetical protein